MVTAVLWLAPSRAEGRSLGATAVGTPLTPHVHHPVLGMVTAVLGLAASLAK